MKLWNIKYFYDETYILISLITKFQIVHTKLLKAENNKKVVLYLQKQVFLWFQ